MGTYEVTTEDGTYQVDVDDGPSMDSEPSGIEIAPTWGQSAKFVGKSLLGGAAKTADLATSAVLDAVKSPYDIFHTMFTGELSKPTAAHPFQNLAESVVGKPEDEGLTGVAPKLVKAALEGSTMPIGGPIGNAVSAVGGEVAHEMFPDSKIAPVVGALVPGLATSAASRLAKGLANTTDDIASALDRKSLGARGSDYREGSTTRVIETPEGEIESFVKNRLDNLLENGDLGVSRDPSKLLKRIREKTVPLSESIQNKITSYDNAIKAGEIPPVQPEFNNTIDYINRKVPADQVDDYLNKLDKLKSSMEKRGEGSLAYIQEQKITHGKSWNPADQVKSGYDRAIYSDLKNTIEKHVPEVKGINQELQKYMIAEPIVKRALNAEEAFSPLSKLRDIGYTTGGIGVPTALGAGLGGPGGAALGAATGLATKALASPTGQALIAKGLRGVSSAEGSIANLLNALSPSATAATTQAVMRGTLSSDLFTGLQNKEEKKQENKSSNNAGETIGLTKEEPDMKGTKEEIEAAIDQDPYTAAVYEAESGRNPNAKNPNSSAKGGFQFVDRTARALGLKNPFDLGESLDAFKKLTDENRRVAGDDPMLLYSAHYLGAPLLKKVLENKPLNNTEQSHVAYLTDKALPRFKNIYEKVIASKNDIGEA